MELTARVAQEDKMANSKGERIWTNIWTGAVGGFIGSLAMNQFQAVVSQIGKVAGNRKAEQQPAAKAGNSAVNAAEAVSKALRCRELTETERKWADPLVHYAFGTAMGALYGAAAEAIPLASPAKGAAFGAALWLGADEVTLPRLGLTGPPEESSLSTHVSGLTAHVLYGFVTAQVRTRLRRRLRSADRVPALKP